MNIAAIAATLRNSKGFAHKRDISEVASQLTAGMAQQPGARFGDDCAVLRDGDGHLLFAIEGFLNEFVAADPWFAGYCAVMVNASDIYSMGGRPLAVVDALWSDGAESAHSMLKGLIEAAEVYGIPIIGGHTNTRNGQGQLAAAILGRATALLTSFDSQPGQMLIAAIDLRGRYREPYAYWDASTNSPPLRLRGDLELLPYIAEAGLSAAAKDISMGGVLGSAMMLLECSGLGADIDILAIPRPPEAPLERWLLSFPSYGFVLSVEEEKADAVLALFDQRGINAAVFGYTNGTHCVKLRDSSDGEEVLLWDFTIDPLIGFGAPIVAESMQ